MCLWIFSMKLHVLKGIIDIKKKIYDLFFRKKQKWINRFDFLWFINFKSFFLIGKHGGFPTLKEKKMWKIARGRRGLGWTIFFCYISQTKKKPERSYPEEKAKKNKFFSFESLGFFESLGLFENWLFWWGIFSKVSWRWSLICVR